MNWAGTSLATISIVLLMPFTSSAQLYQTYAFHGDSMNDSYASFLSHAGDVNNDGFDDVIVGAPLDDNNGGNSGSARVYSGFDGSILYHFDGAPGAFFGRSVGGAGDCNGDGFDDVVIGAHRDSTPGLLAGSVSVYSGATGARLFVVYGSGTNEFFGGHSSGAGDVNGDGFDDIIVSAISNSTNGSGAGLVLVLSGINGAVIHQFLGDDVGDRLGEDVCGIGDVNADGFDDLAVSATGVNTLGPFTGMVRVFSGIDGSILYQLDGSAADDHFGLSVAAAGDVNSDGCPDLIVGVPGDSTMNGVGAGSAQVFSGTDGTLLYKFHGDGDDNAFGRRVSTAGDVDGDGFDDVIIGTFMDDNNGNNSGSARVHSGADGSVIMAFHGTTFQENYGFDVSGGGDVNGDGLGDVIMSARSGVGTAYVYTAGTEDIFNLYTHNNATHFLDLTWLPLGGNIDSPIGTLQCTGAIPGGAGLAVASLVSQDVLAFGYLPVLIDVSSANLTVNLPIGFNAIGALVAPNVSRKSPALAGMDLHIQFFQIQPFVFSSNVVRMRLVP